MKVLLSAYACEPGKGSEPGVGWNTAKAIAKHHDVWVLTTKAHQPGIEAEQAKSPNPNLHFIYVDPLGWVYDWSNEGKRFHWDVHLHYYLWQIQAYRVARTWHKKVGFSVAHHVTYVKYSGPSFLSLLPIPFVWGPVGGGESAPPAFWQDFSLYGKVYETARNLLRQVGELDPFMRMTARRSEQIFATTEETAERLERMGFDEVHVMSALGLSDDDLNQLGEIATEPAHPPRFISLARLLHWKGLHLGIKAFAAANLPEVEYWILGDGPERDNLQQLAQDLGVGDRVKFLNKQPYQEALQKLSQSLALVHPSLHESGGWVCLEAMALGCPVICLDLGGPATQVSKETGFKIQASTPAQSIQNLTAAMVTLATHSQKRAQLGEAGKKRARTHFNWDIKGELFSSTYKKICTESTITR